MRTVRGRALVCLGGMVILSALALADSRQSARPAAAPASQRIVGAWELQSRTVRRANGASLQDSVLGEKPLGHLYYDASGVMSLQMMRLGRKEPISTPSSPADRHNPRVILGYDSYFGRFTIDERAGTITHRVEGSLFPEDLGKDFVRRFTLDGDALTLAFTSPAEGDDVTRTLIFRRIR